MKGIIDLMGIVFAVVFGFALAALAVFTQSVLLPVFIGLVTFIALMFKDGLFKIKV